MDLLSLIREKSKSFVDSEFYEGIEAVILHISVAESHLENAKKLGEYLYTDVIYRTNQAFEGALKEAYRVLAGKNPSGVSPFTIEQYLENKGLLRERVLAQFKNYRTEWRNAWTHDYQLFFTSQEALLAIVSISAFFSILLDQMVERYAHDQEKLKLRERSYSLARQVPNYAKLDFLDQCVELLKRFSIDIERDAQGSRYPSEYEILGKLSGFISESDPSVSVTAEKVVRDAGRRLMLDLVLEKDNRSVIVELKRPSMEWRRRFREGLEQLKTYLVATGSDEGILFVPSLNRESIGVEKRTLELGNKKVRIVLIGPNGKQT